jgi:phosphate transport system ATP-binding protein
LSTSVVEETLRELKQRYTIIMVPHSVQQAARVADRAGFMLDGELVEIATAERMFLHPAGQAHGGLHHGKVWIVGSRQ